MRGQVTHPLNAYWTRTVEGREQIYVGALIVLIVATSARLWLLQLGASFWLDETGTAWLIEEDLWTTVSRSFEYQGGSTLFLVIEWLVKQLAGLREVALRLPSVVGMAGAAYFIYAFGRHQYDRWVGLIGASLFVSLPAVAFAASDARPYALALAGLTGSAFALVRWIDHRTIRRAILYAALVAATASLHYLFLLPLLSHAVYLLSWKRAGGELHLRDLGVLVGVSSLFLLPTLPTLLRVIGSRSILSNPYPSEPHAISSFLVPPGFAYLLVAAVLIAALVAGSSLQRNGYRTGTLPLLIAWLAIPSIALYEISNRTATYVFVPRYFLMITPALAILIAIGVRQLSRREAQLVVTALVAIFAFRNYETTTHTLEDWRSAATVQRAIVTDPSTPVLLFSGFIEANQISWLSDPEKASYLNAPAAMYPLEGSLIPTPFSLEGEGLGYMERVVRDRLLPARRFLLVTRGSDPYKAWLDPVVAPAGFAGSLIASFNGEIIIYEYSRPA